MMKYKIFTALFQKIIFAAIQLTVKKIPAVTFRKTRFRTNSSKKVMLLV